MSKKLPKEITSYDLLKTFAVIIMIVDHVGAYFFPDQLWWRAVGRLSFPVWFFLIGYARGRDVSVKLLGGAGILLFGNWMAGMPIFPLNALFTIAFIRVVIDRVMRFSLKNSWCLWGGAGVMFAFILPSYFITDYGLQALIMAMFGYMARHRKEIADERLVVNYMFFTLFGFVITQQIGFSFSMMQFVCVVVTGAVLRMSLYYFKAEMFPKLTSITAGPLVWLIQFCGRRTLEIFVVHLMIFKMVGLYLGMDGFSLFTLKWIDHSAIAFFRQFI